jgi:hypothetical protein
LSAKIEKYDAKIREKAEHTLARLGFDHSPEGERITRFKTRCKSDLFKAIDMYKNIRSKRNSIAGGRGEVESGGANQLPDDSVASVIEQAENLLRAFAPDDPSPARSPHPPVASPPLVESPPHAAMGPAHASKAQSSDPCAGLSKREKRRGRRELRQQKLERPSPMSPPTTRAAHPPTPPPNAVPSPERGEIIKPGVPTPGVGTSTPASGASTPSFGVSIPGMDLSILGSNSSFGAMNASIRELLARSPEAMEYLQSFLQNPGALGGAG